MSFTERYKHEQPRSSHRVPPPKPQKLTTLHSEISKNAIYQQIESYRSLVQSTVRGITEPLLFVGGCPGIGKSFLVREECAKAGIRPVFISPTTPSSFNQELYRNRNTNVVVLDDADVLATQATVANLIKGAYGSERTAIWQTVEADKNERARGTNKYNPSIPAGLYKVRTKLIWLTNLDFTQSLDQVRPDMQVSFEAICSRGGDPMYISGEPIDLFRYTIWLATKGRLFDFKKNELGETVGNRISKTAAVEAINWFNANRNRVRELSPRTLSAIASYAHNFERSKTEANEKERFKIYERKAESVENVRNIVGYGRLEMVGPGKWKETETRKR
jgi:hypothetical protein